MGDELPPGIVMIEALAPSDPLRRLHDDIRMLLHLNRSTVPYHGWPHVHFVTQNAMRLAQNHGAESALVGSTALVHDLNYLVQPDSQPLVGDELASRYLKAAGFDDLHIARALQIVKEANLSTRGPNVSLEVACLSDADTLFKVLPLVPVLQTPSYLAENQTTLRDLAQKIVDDQLIRLDSGYFFYLSEVESQYLGWAHESVSMWQRVLDALGDPEIAMLAEQIQNQHEGGRHV